LKLLPLTATYKVAVFLYLCTRLSPLNIKSRDAYTHHEYHFYDKQGGKEIKIRKTAFREIGGFLCFVLKINLIHIQVLP
jgi:hypothetical protein